MTDLWFRRGEVVAAAGAPDDRLLVVRDGLVGLQIDRAWATQPLWVTLVGRGRTLGEAALLEDPGPRSLSAVALTPTRVTEVLVEELPELDRLSLLPLAVEVLAGQVREQEGKATYLRSASAAQRVAGCLCDLVRLLGPGPGRPVGELERGLLTQQQMAQYVGCARDAVNKTLAGFVRSGWVELSGSHIRVVDLPALHAFSGTATRGRDWSFETTRSHHDLAERLLLLVDAGRRPGRPCSERGAA